MTRAGATGILTRALLLLAFSESKAVAADPACFKYEPEQVMLEGVVERQKFPGRPNYESVKSGDEPETFWLLKVDPPICVEGPPDELNSREQDVSRVQLVLDAEEYARWNALVGQRARATGALTHAISGHHHTPVLLSVRSLVRAR